MAEQEEPCVVRTIDSSLKRTEPKYIQKGSIKEGFSRLKAKNIEAVSHNKQVIVNGSHGFVNAVYHAFNNHIPLAFGPDHIWNLIIHGVSKHIENNAEQLRDKFVDFDGKETLTIRRDNFVKGSPANDWAGCFSEWSEQITGFIGEENRDNLVSKFSTTGSLETALGELALMDCMKSYFEFRCCTCCGISKVKLYGTEEDWAILRAKTQGLREYGLGWWIDVLDPVLENILKTYRGQPVNEKFWYTIYKRWSTGGSGATSYVTGWITHFFPYLEKRKRTKFSTLEELYQDAAKTKPNTWGHYGSCRLQSIDIYDVPNGVASTPFTWDYNGALFDMQFYGGFAACEMDGEFIRPVLAWAVGQSDDAKTKSLIRKNGEVASWSPENVYEWFKESSDNEEVLKFAAKALKAGTTGEQLLTENHCERVLGNVPYPVYKLLREVQTI